MRKRKPKWFCQQLHDYTQHYGESKRLAILVNVSPTTMSLWCTGKRKVPVHRCLDISRATGGYVQPYMLRPDINWSET